MSTKYQVTDSRGQVHKRTTKERTYTHAVVIHCGIIPANENWREQPAKTIVQWAGRPDLARKAADQSKKYWGFEAVEIIPAVEVRR